MNAQNDFKKRSHRGLNARLVEARLRFAELADFVVARWLERCAANAEAAQYLFRTDRKPARDFAMRVSLVVSSPGWDESP